MCELIALIRPANTPDHHVITTVTWDGLIAAFTACFDDLF